MLCGIKLPNLPDLPNLDNGVFVFGIQLARRIWIGTVENGWCQEAAKGKAATSRRSPNNGKRQTDARQRVPTGALIPRTTGCARSGFCETNPISVGGGLRRTSGSSSLPYAPKASLTEGAGLLDFGREVSPVRWRSVPAFDWAVQIHEDVQEHG